MKKKSIFDIWEIDFWLLCKDGRAEESNEIYKKIISYIDKIYNDAKENKGKENMYPIEFCFKHFKKDSDVVVNINNREDYVLMRRFYIINYKEFLDREIEFIEDKDIEYEDKIKHIEAWNTESLSNNKKYYIDINNSVNPIQDFITNIKQQKEEIIQSRPLK